MQRLWIPGRIPGLNEIIEASVASGPVDARGKRSSSYRRDKKALTATIDILVGWQKVKPMAAGYFTYLFCEPNRRRDPSNFVAGGVKVIEDALRKAGVIPGDGWNVVRGYAPYWICDPTSPGVAVYLTIDRVLERGETVRHENAYGRSYRENEW